MNKPNYDLVALVFIIGILLIWLLAFRKKTKPVHYPFPDPPYTHSIVVRLDPAPLPNPEIDIRWDLVEAVGKRLGEPNFCDDGFGYGRNSHAMLIFFASEEPEKDISAIVHVLENENIRNNRLADGAIVGIAKYGIGDDLTLYKAVYPPNIVGNKLQE